MSGEQRSRQPQQARGKPSHYVNPRERSNNNRGVYHKAHRAKSHYSGQRGQQQPHRRHNQNQNQNQNRYRNQKRVLGPAAPRESYPSDVFFGTSSLVEQLDKPVLVLLQDKKHVVGVLRSFDQFGNFVLQNACHRKYHENVFTDMPLGLFIIRGETVELLGELDVEKDTNGVEGGLKRVSNDEFKQIKEKV